MTVDEHTASPPCLSHLSLPDTDLSKVNLVPVRLQVKGGQACESEHAVLMLAKD